MTPSRFAATMAFACLAAACQTMPSTDATAATTPPADAADTCRSQPLAGLVGQDRSQAPASTQDRPVRVVCDTCPMTMDYNAQRLNVIFDQATGVVRKLSCG